MAYRDEVLADSPIAYWPLDDAGTIPADAPTVAEVVAGRAMTNGTNTPGKPSLLPNGTGTAFQFSGSTISGADARMQRANEAALRPAAFTVEVWVKPTNVTAGAYRGALASFATSTAGWALHTYGPNIRVVTYSGAGAAVALTGTTAMSVGGKYQVVMTYNAGVITTYVNGVQDATISGKTITQQSTSPFRVGSLGLDDISVAFPITADLDEVSYYGTALSAARIKAHYDAAVATAPAAITVAGEAFTVSDTALDGTPLVGIGVPGEAFTVTATAGNGQTNQPVKVAGSAFAVTATAGAGIILGTAILVPGDAFVVTSTALDGTPPVAPVLPSTTDTARYENGRTRSGSAVNMTATALPDAPSTIQHEPIRIRALSLPKPTLVNGRPA